eukprot:4698089-Heterocapsa_arctica.AAC.1
MEHEDATLDRPRIHLQAGILQLVSWGQQGLLTQEEYEQVYEHLHNDSYYRDPRPPPRVKYRIHGKTIKHDHPGPTPPTHHYISP